VKTVDFQEGIQFSVQYACQLSSFLDMRVTQGGEMSAEKSVLIDEPRGVDISLVERELTRLWKDASEDQEVPGASPVIRACSMNLVVVMDDASRAPMVGELVGDVSVSHPSRIFLVVLDTRREEPRLDAWVSARCSLPIPGRNQVCCEEITLTASGSERQKVPGIVMPLLVPDLPTVVLWKSDAVLEESGIGWFLPFADRVIIDSSQQDRPEALLHSWGRFVDSRDDPVGDLSWTRLAPWRSLLARVFQPVELRTVLAEVTRVEIEFLLSSSPVRSGLAQAYLLSAWLADRLGWEEGKPFQASASGTLSASFYPGPRDDPFTLQLTGVPGSDASSGTVKSVMIRGAGESLVRLTLTEKGDCVRLEKRIEEHSSQEIVHHLVRQGEALLLARELDILQKEPAYERTMLRLLQHLPEQGR
jgi:glucose-6-phosphate dehydrogenase assembly protein OpcA